MKRATETDRRCFPCIVGCGRSGTTLLRAMLDSHPDLVVPPESRFIPSLIEHFDTAGPVQTDAVVEVLQADRHFQHWGVDTDVVRDRLGPTQPTLADAVRGLFEIHADRAGKPRYADKSPPYVMQIPAVAGLLPEARFIHLVRDGRDVALAYRDAPFGPSSIPELALHWKLRVERGSAAGARLGTTRYLELAYEQLVADPEGTLRTVCRFIDLPYDPAMLDYPDRVDAVIRHDRQPQNHRNLALAPTTGLRDWRKQMSNGDVARFEALAGSTLDRLGYERSGLRPGIADRLTIATDSVRWNLRRARKKFLT